MKVGFSRGFCEGAGFCAEALDCGVSLPILVKSKPATIRTNTVPRTSDDLLGLGIENFFLAF